MSEDLARYEGRTGVVNFEDYAMNVDSLVRQVNLIQDVMAKVMKDGEHYGVIPGTKKPTLLKPGAEKLCMVFRLEPNYEIIREFREDLFIAYTVKCTLTHIPSGQVIASGVGACNSREAKYRFRYIEELTGIEVPKGYWDAKKAGDAKEMKRLIGEGMRPRKNEETGKWVIAKSIQVDNDNPWDLDNTIMKMACKRALVAATLNATAASDIFTQDVEDMPEGTVQENKAAGQQNTIQEPQSKGPKNPDAPASEAQIKAISTMCGKAGIADDGRHAWAGVVLDKTVSSFKELTMGDASKLIDKLNAMLAERAA